ncbi:DUF4342 domain-containing protein [Desulfosporosinus sp. Sb-LF]|uniref:DUF4342 domain-containing protein n=1 Tax=Desulfosporosinus sp. Sb-LF TaxID=2560027 RepID=UPI0032B7E2D2
MNLSEPLWTELEKLDVLRERMGIGYEEARKALSLAQGDVVKALDDLEKARNEKDMDWNFADQGQGIWNGVKSTVTNLSHTTVSLKRHDNTIVSLSAPLGLALAYTIWRKPGLRMLALMGAVGAAINHFELEVSSKAEYPYNDDAFNFDTDRVGKPL